MRAAIGLVVICGLTYLFTRLSLDNVSGATRRRNGTCCNTEFVHGEWWLPVGSVIHGLLFAVAAAIGVLSWRRMAKAARES